MFTPNYVYLRYNKKNSLLPAQMPLSKKPNLFCGFFIAFLESTWNLEHFEKKSDSHSLSISENIRKYFWLRKTWLLKCIKGPVSEDPSGVNVLMGWSCEVTRQVKYVSTCRRPMITRLGSVLTYCEKLLPLKLHDPLMT